MTAERTLTISDITALRWSVSCNERGVGYLGPTVKRHGPLPELTRITAEGLLRCEEDVRSFGRRDAEQCGYWITDAGRAALVAAGDRS